MKINNLNPKKYKRFFAFGCSFTSYIWPTWADIIGQDIEFYENWGEPSSGNHFIFNSFIEADARYNFNSDDLVIIMWSTKEREDRYSNGKWLHATCGNIEEQYGKEWTKKFYFDSRSQLIRDAAFIKATQTILEKKDIDWANLVWYEYFNSSNLRSIFYNLKSESEKDEMLLNWKEKCKDIFNGKEISDIFDDTDVISLYQDIFTNISGVYSWFRDEKINKKTARNNDDHPTPREALDFLDWVWPNNTISKKARDYAIKWDEEISKSKFVFERQKIKRL